MLQACVVYAGVEQQIIVPVSLAKTLTIKEVIQESGILMQVTELGNVDDLSMGIYGRRKSLDDCVNDGDRVEIYRPLKCDPKVGRQQRVELERAERKKSAR